MKSQTKFFFNELGMYLFFLCSGLIMGNTFMLEYIEGISVIDHHPVMIIMFVIYTIAGLYLYGCNLIIVRKSKEPIYFFWIKICGEKSK